MLFANSASFVSDTETVNSTCTNFLIVCSLEYKRTSTGAESILKAGSRSADSRAPDSYDRGPGFDTQSGHKLSFLLPLIQEGQLSVTGESMCTKYWLTA